MSDHDPKTTDFNRAFLIGILLNTAYVAAEAGFGFAFNSLALLADAGHNLGDVFSLILAWGAAVLARRQATKRRTYGWRGATIMAALTNALLLMVAVGMICLEAVRRLRQPPEAAGTIILIVAGIGLLINTLTALLFMTGREKDLNIRAAFIHMAADAGVSAGVLAAGLGIMITGWRWLDPAVSLAVAVVIFVGTWNLLKESVYLSVQAAPAWVDLDGVRAYLAELPEVEEVHHLHVWALSTSETALTVHLVKPDPARDDELLAQITHELHERFDIDHPTIQWERCAEGYPCRD